MAEEKAKQEEEMKLLKEREDEQRRLLEEAKEKQRCVLIMLQILIFSSCVWLKIILDDAGQ